MNMDKNSLCNIEKMLREMILREAVRTCEVTAFMDVESFKQEVSEMSNQAIGTLTFDILLWYSMLESVNTFEESISIVKINKKKNSKNYESH